jgi:hypothetical protein
VEEGYNFSPQQIRRAGAKPPRAGGWEEKRLNKEGLGGWIAKQSRKFAFKVKPVLYFKYRI